MYKRQVLRGGAYLRHGMMGADVLANLVSAAHAKELYVILDMNTAEPECWACLLYTSRCV